MTMEPVELEAILNGYRERYKFWNTMRTGSNMF